MRICEFLPCFIEASGFNDNNCLLMINKRLGFNDFIYRLVDKDDCKKSRVILIVRGWHFVAVHF
jgi:hypothetical protein